MLIPLRVKEDVKRPFIPILVSVKTRAEIHYKENINAMQDSLSTSGVESALCLLLWLGVANPPNTQKENLQYILTDSSIKEFVQKPFTPMFKMIIFPCDDIFGIQGLIRRTQEFSEVMDEYVTLPFLPAIDSAC